MSATIPETTVEGSPMPLLDHFHGPMAEWPWGSFHTQWISEFGAWLNRRLTKPRYHCWVQTHMGTRIEADVAEYDFHHGQEFSTNGSTATAVEIETAPVATLTIPAIFPDELEVQIVDTRAGATLVAVIELISPGNLDRPDTRLAFATKCAAYLRRGIGVLIIDIVTSHHFNLHNSLLDLLGQPESVQMPDDCITYVASYHPTRRDESNLIDFWPVPLVVGSPLPTIPLVLRGGPRIAINLEEIYSSARDRDGI